MESIKINTGIIKLEIDRDGEKSVISFNPNDIEFVDKLYNLFFEFEEKQKEYESKRAEIERQCYQDGALDGISQQIALAKEVCLYLKDKVDYVFGVGTSEKVFGRALDIEMFPQFFDGIVPFIQKASNDRIGKYVKKSQGNVMS